MVEWDRRVAREAEHQARIEAAFDWADEHDRLGNVALALEWLDKASALSGGLTPAYREKRLRLSREVARPREAPMTPVTSLASWVSGGREAAWNARRAVLAGDGAMPTAVGEEILLPHAYAAGASRHAKAEAGSESVLTSSVSSLSSSPRTPYGRVRRAPGGG